MDLLAKVKDTFAISGRGIAVVIEFVSESGKIRVGDRVFLKNPDGSAHDTQVRGVEISCSPGTQYHPRKPCQTGLMLGAELSKEDILANAEIYVFPDEQAVRNSMKSQAKSS
jgi:hypothetical protein